MVAFIRRRDPDLLQLLKWTYDVCEICPSSQNLHLHHVIFRKHGGDDVRANIICLCQTCHEAYHGADPIVRREVAMLIKQERQDTADYLVLMLGTGGCEQWFIRHGI